MTCTAGGGDVLYSRRWGCLEWPDTEMSCMAEDCDVSYGQRWLLTLVRADGIQPYWYVHIYPGPVALLDRIQSSFSITTISTDTGFEITNYHSDFYIGSTFRIGSPISHISITRPLYRLIHHCSQAKRKWDVYYLWISTGCNFSIFNGHCLSAGQRIPGRWPNHYWLMPQWFLPREMRCCQYQTTMATRDMQGHMRNKSLTNNWCIRVLSTEWTYMNQPLVWTHSPRLGE